LLSYAVSALSCAGQGQELVTVNTLWTVLTIIEVIYVAILCAWIVLEKRSPIATLAWMLGLAAVPLVGLALYFFLGPRRMKRRKLRHARSRVLARECAPARPDASLELPHKGQIVALTSRTSGAPLSTCRSVKVFGTGDECLAAILEAIRSAEHHVHAEYYIFEQDATGHRVRDALAECARRGVKVRLLVDAVGSPIDRRFLRCLREAGVEFARFNPVRFGSLRPRVNFRNHRKILVVDGSVGFLGGMNIGDDYSEAASGAKAYRDTHLRIDGSAVCELQLAFLEDWHFATGRMLERERLFFVDLASERSLVQIVASGPDMEWEPVQKLFFASIASAEQSVEITTPYFVPDEAIMRAIETAALRGVQVDIVVPTRSDSRIVSAATRSYYDSLLRAGVYVWQFPRMVHAKTMVVDGKLGIVGSANMDNRSFRLNFEIVAALYCKDAIEELQRLFAQDKAMSVRVTSGTRARLGLAMRFEEASARLLSPML
jgi:cardiolipin synthase A/B